MLPPTTATLFLHQGCDPKTVSAVPRHPHLAVTIDYDAHVTAALTGAALAGSSATLGEG